MKEELEFWRNQIDTVDRELVRLLRRRTDCAVEIGRLKALHGTPVYDPLREEEVYQNVQEAACGSLTGESARRIFERIVDETRRAERALRRVTDGGLQEAGEGARNDHRHEG